MRTYRHSPPRRPLQVVEVAASSATLCDREDKSSLA